MNKSEYQSLLERLPITSPTIDDMAALCPHLTPKEAAAAFISDTGSGYVACPPLRIRGGFQILTYHKEWVKDIYEDGVVVDRKNQPARIYGGQAGRTIESYADRRPHGDVFLSYLYMDRAIRFAEEHWGEFLVVDDWKSAGMVIIQDPTDLVSDGYVKGSPKTKAVLYLALNRDINCIVNDHSKPESEVFDEAIVATTCDRLVYQEILGGRGGFTYFNCAHCGSGLNIDFCAGCRHKFTDNGMRCGWNTPLSKKMVEFLETKGHQFIVDLEIARNREREQWDKIPEENKRPFLS